MMLTLLLVVSALTLVTTAVAREIRRDGHRRLSLSDVEDRGM